MNLGDLHPNFSSRAHPYPIAMLVGFCHRTEEEEYHGLIAVNIRANPERSVVVYPLLIGSGHFQCDQVGEVPFESVCMSAVYRVVLSCV